MVRCPHCQVSLAAGARYCLECGRPVDDAVDLGRTLPSSDLQRFAGMPLGEDTMLDPGPAAPSGPTGLLRAARASAGQADSLPDAAVELGPPAPPPPPATPPPSSAPPSSAPPSSAPPSGPAALADTVDPLPAVETPPPVEAPPAVETPPPAPARAEPAVAHAVEPSTPPRTSGPPRPGDPPAPGEEVEGYIIQDEIGRGGMGRVYRATHAVTGQAVALKMLKPQVATGRVRERFVNEARVLARLDHPNLVPLLGFVDLPRGLFIIMPFVKGITLEAMLRRQGRLALDIVEPLFVGLCAGVAYIHDQSLLHRDLKPGNIIVQSDGQPRLTDFGIAREAGSEGLTATGLVIGTAEYIAPEQANGSLRDDPRSDQYSLGCLLYQMLVGQPPFRHPNVGKLLVKHIQDVPPPPRTIAPDIPEPVEQVILKAIAKKPDDRYPDVSALARALSQAAALSRDPASVPTVALDPAEVPQSAARRRPWLWIGLGLAGAYAAAAGLWWWFSHT